MTQEQWSEFCLLWICNYREAYNELPQSKLAQAWSVMNRAKHPSWWGASLSEVILKPFQYSCFNKNDPAYLHSPHIRDPKAIECYVACYQAYNALIPDPTGGADSYFDRSLDADPPVWAKSASHCCDIGSFHFFRVRGVVGEASPAAGTARPT